MKSNAKRTMTTVLMSEELAPERVGAGFGVGLGVGAAGALKTGGI